MSVYKVHHRAAWFAQVLGEFGIEYTPRPLPPRWTPERVAQAVAQHGWKTRAEMKRAKLGASILMSCYGKPDMLAQLPTARFKSPDSAKIPRPTVPVNCWPFGAAKPRKRKSPQEQTACV
jgi:hypothetical protein